MGVLPSTTFIGDFTPICEDCGIRLCWDISREDYAKAQPFWDAWKCQECNGGRPMSAKAWMAVHAPGAINSFRDEFAFLSNFFAAPIRINGLCFPTNEHAFVAFKTTNLALRAEIARIPTAGKVKRFGHKLPLRPGWNEIRIDVMRKLVWAKYRQHPQLAALLLATGDRPIFEGNTWNDRFWGVDLKTGEGENHLGRIHAEIRATLRAA